MVKTNIPERTTEMRMQSELHRDLWAVTGRGHAGFLGRACPDSPQPSLPMTAASLLPLLPPPSPPLDQVLFSSLEFLFLFLLVRAFWMSFLLDSPICILSGGGEKTHVAIGSKELGQAAL